MKNGMRKRILSVCLVILLSFGMLPAMMSTAYATINGTVTFVSSDSTNIGQILHDGDAGSSDIAEISLDIFNAGSPEEAAAGTYTGSWVYFDTSNIGGAYPAIAPIDVASGTQTIGNEPPRYFAIKSTNGSNFSFQSIYFVDYTGSQPEVKFDGYRDGNYIGTVTLDINRSTYYETFQLGTNVNNLTQTIFQNVDMVLVSNPDTSTWVTGNGNPPPHGNWVCINNIKIGDPVFPTVTAVSPSSGSTAGGTSVTITGTNFTGVTGVKFGNNAATGVTVNSTTSITAIAPAGSGNVDVTVTADGGTGTGTGLYTYKQNQAAITYNNVTKTYGDAPFTYTATGGSGTGAFSYTSSDTSVATINSTSGSVTILKAGTTTLTATKAADSEYSSASQSCTLTVKSNQAAITYNDVTKACGDADFVYTASGGSGTGTFSYASSDPTVATINSGTGNVKILKVGTTTLTAIKAADTNYNEASKGCTLTVNKGNQAAITYNNVTKAFGDAPFTYTASGGSGTGTFSYTTSDPTVATIDPSTGSVSILKVGTTTLTATKAADANYNEASKGCTLTVNKGNQAAITFNDVTKTYGDVPFTYTATGGSGTGTFSYTSSDPTVATIDPDTG
ncbi:MAG TPA: IPT/TIG domain-containing protein, partial [Clostridia bacterium]|nr:IPT/TIG domain-containing protein [Clostridia bacterium]